MPNLIATKDFIDGLFVEYDKNNNTIDLSTFIKEDFFGYDLICDFKTIEDYKLAAKENPIWESMMDKYDGSSLNQNLKKDIYEGRFYQNLDEHNIFLVDLPEEQCDKLISEKGYLYIQLSNISKNWDSIRRIRNQLKLKVTLDNKIPQQMRFDCWSKITSLKIPLTSIVIFDRYILGDESNQKLNDNLYKVLSGLCNLPELTKKVNLTIISEFKSDKDILNAYDKLSKYLVSIGISNIKLNIIKHHKRNYPEDFEGLHYRLIITNYFKVKCDDSFNFFKQNGKINNDADLYVTFNLDSSNKPFFEKELNDIKRYLGKLKNLSPDNLLAEKIYFLHDKDNYLFN